MFVRRDGPAHSSDREGIFKLIWKIRKRIPTWIGGLKRTPRGWDGHSGSVDWYDFFGLPPYNDNEVKAQRRKKLRPYLRFLRGFGSEGAKDLLRRFKNVE